MKNKIDSAKIEIMNEDGTFTELGFVSDVKFNPTEKDKEIMDSFDGIKTSGTFSVSLTNNKKEVVRFMRKIHLDSYLQTFKLYRWLKGLDKNDN